MPCAPFYIQKGRPESRPSIFPNQEILVECVRHTELEHPTKRAVREWIIVQIS